jgi:hypothetical protein
VRVSHLGGPLDFSTSFRFTVGDVFPNRGPKKGVSCNTKLVARGVTSS